MILYKYYEWVKKLPDRDVHSAPLEWKDFEMIATWMAREIAGNYIMSKKAYNNQPAWTPYCFCYRKPIFLYHEEQTVYALFIKYIFFTFLKTGKQSGFNQKDILRKIVSAIGLTGNYDRNTDLNILCRCFLDIFPSFIHFLRDRGVRLNVAL